MIRSCAVESYGNIYWLILQGSANLTGQTDKLAQRITTMYVANSTSYHFHFPLPFCVPTPIVVSLELHLPNAM